MGDVDSESKIPGISFWLAGDKSRGLVGGKSHVELTLIGEYVDEELWKKVQKRLREGFRIYTEEDLQGEVLLLMRSDYQAEMTAHEATKHAFKLEVARRIKSEEELARLKNLLGSLGAGLGKR